MTRIRMLARLVRAVAVRAVLRPLARPVAAMIILSPLVLTIDMKKITVDKVILLPCPLLMEDTLGTDGGTNQRKFLLHHRCPHSTQWTRCLLGYLNNSFIRPSIY